MAGYSDNRDRSDYRVGARWWVERKLKANTSNYNTLLLFARSSTVPSRLPLAECQAERSPMNCCGGESRYRKAATPFYERNWQKKESTRREQVKAWWRRSAKVDCLERFLAFCFFFPSLFWPLLWRTHSNKTMLPQWKAALLAQITLHCNTHAKKGVQKGCIVEF